MAQEGVKIKKLQGGLGGVNASTDGYSCLVVGADVTGIAATHDNIYELLQASDADSLGFTASYDSNNATLVRNHIEEFFFYAPTARLFIIPTATGQAQNAMLSVAVQNLIKSKASIKIVGIVNGTYTVGTTEGLVQTVVDALAAEYLLIDSVILEGTGDQFEDGANADLAISAFTDLRTLTAANVSVCIAQDGLTDVLQGNPATNHKANVGAALGMLAVRFVSEHIGSIQIEGVRLIDREFLNTEGDLVYSLNDIAATRWQEARLSNGMKVSELSVADSKALQAKGYIFADNYIGFAGYYFMDDATCIATTSDYSQIRINRIWNKCARAIRVKLLPKVKSKIKKDAATGLMTTTTVKSLENLAGNQLLKIQKDGDISGYAVKIVSDQAVDVDNALVVKVQLTIDDIVYKFEVGVGFAVSLG